MTKILLKERALIMRKKGSSIKDKNDEEIKFVNENKGEA